jgi:TetR/AcrR family transcriptional regulator, fatty acid metabolism regulator protein
MRPEIHPKGQNVRSFIERARRAQIIECAVEVIAEQGYVNASLAAIARRAGISKGVISYHFAGKDELIEQIVAQSYATAAGFVQSLLKTEATAGEKLRCYILGTMANMQAHPRQVQALIEIFRNFRGKDGRPRFDAYDDERLLQDVEEILRQGQASGEFRRFSTRFMALAIQSALASVPLQLSLHHDTDFDLYGRELAELFERATRADAPPAKATAAVAGSSGQRETET